MKLFGQVFGPTIQIPKYYSGCQKKTEYRILNIVWYWKNLNTEYKYCYSVQLFEKYLSTKLFVTPCILVSPTTKFHSISRSLTTKFHFIWGSPTAALVGAALAGRKGFMSSCWGPKNGVKFCCLGSWSRVKYVGNTEMKWTFFVGDPKMELNF